MPQSPAVYGKLSAAENLRLFARLEQVADVDGSGRADARRRPASPSARDDQVAQLSGGNRQRVNVAIGLLSEPARAAARRAQRGARPAPARAAVGVPRRARRSDGTTVVFATHMVSEAERYADRVLVLADGERLFWGPPAELRETRRRSPGDLEAAFVAFLRQHGH